MNFARNAILTAIIFQMMNSTFPLTQSQARAENSSASEEQTTLPSTNRFIDTVIEHRKALEAHGCVDKNGNVQSRAMVDQDEIHKENGKAFNCYDAVKTYLAAEKQALEIIKEQESLQNKNCAECSSGSSLDSITKATGKMQGIAEEYLSEGKSCSNEEKATIQKENKSCDYWCGARNAAAATYNNLGAFNPATLPLKLAFGDLKISKAPNCPIPQGNAGDCFLDIVKTFVASMGDLVLGLWNGSIALANKAGAWAKGLFAEHKEVEAAATTKALACSNLSNEQIAQAKKDGGKGFMAHIKSGLLSIVDFFTNYKELGTEFDCVHCRDKLKPICKVIGLIGRDAVIAWLSGKALSAMGPLVKRLANKTALSRRIYRKGFVAIGRLSQKTAAKWSAFKATTIKFSKATFKHIGELPEKIVLSAHNTTGKVLKKMGNQNQILSTAMGEEGKLATKPINDAIKNVSVLEVGTEIPGQRAAVLKAREEIAKLPNAKKWAKPEMFENIETATSAEFRLSERTVEQIEKSTAPGGKGRKIIQSRTPLQKESFLAVETSAGIREIPLDLTQKIASVETFENAKGATNIIVKHADGSSVIHTAEGKVKIPLEKVSLYEEATGKKINGRPAEEVRLETTRQNIEEQGMPITENKDGTYNVDAGEKCGGKVRVGLAI